MKPVSNCKDCGNRTVGCHSTCEDYQTYLQAKAAYETAKFEDKKTHYYPYIKKYSPGYCKTILYSKNKVR